MERRKNRDFWARLLVKLNIVSWLIFIFILLVFHRAQPEFETLFDRFYNLRLRTDWDIQYLYYLIVLVVFGIFTSLFGLILVMYRGRRTNDHKKMLIFTGAISLILLGVSVALIGF
ncbi:MAG: hypothetical protein ABIJ59_16355 [Pseudomonadota bacterium]